MAGQAHVSVDSDAREEAYTTDSDVKVYCWSESRTRGSSWNTMSGFRHAPADTPEKRDNGIDDVNASRINGSRYQTGDRVSQETSLARRDVAVPVLKFFRFLLVQDETALDNTWWDQDTWRYHWDGVDLETYGENPLVTAIQGYDLDNESNGRRLAFLAEKAQEFRQGRPTLLRFGSEIWCSQVTGRTRRQQEIRSAAIQAVVLRSIYEDTANVLMSQHSLSKMVELLTGRTPGNKPIQNMFDWFGSEESPFEVVHRGRRGWIGRSTTIKVTMPKLQNWRLCLDEAEQAKTVRWLSEYDAIMHELAADEVRRRDERAATEARRREEQT